jgi:uncharacterized protein YdeI (YjbR/CyaY-like superfamily)
VDVGETLIAENREEWRAWLSENAARSADIWLLLGKNGSGVLTVAYDEAVEEALCFGWIDGQAKK